MLFWHSSFVCCLVEYTVYKFLYKDNLIPKDIIFYSAFDCLSIAKNRMQQAGFESKLKVQIVL